MPSSLEIVTVSDFIARSCVRQACETQPHTPQSILSFFFGVDLMTTTTNSQLEQSKQAMRVPMFEMGAVWYGASPEYDDLCRRSFSSIVSAIGTNKSASTLHEASSSGESEHAIWNETIDGKVAQMIACDQLARKCFRGTDEAFAYDSVAEAISIELITHLLSSSSLGSDKSSIQQDETASASSSSPLVLEGEFYPPYISFLTLPLMHSESLANHELSLQVFEYALDSTKNRNTIPNSLHPKFEYGRSFLLEHKAVLDEFGRYPHRNKALGRTSTKEELAWLADVDALPGWAKSQG